MFHYKTLRCDCGYEVHAPDEDALLIAIRRHASEAHGIDFSLELARDIARKALEPAQDGALGRETE